MSVVGTSISSIVLAEAINTTAGYRENNIYSTGSDMLTEEHLYPKVPDA